MRKKLLGLVTAWVAGAATSQAQYTNPPVPAMIPGGPNGSFAPQLAPGPGMLPPGADPRQMLPPNYQPTYPPPGPYAQTMYESPELARSGGGNNGPVAPRIWFKGDYLLMFLKPQPSNNVLATTGVPNVGADNGVLGEATTISLFGQENFSSNPASGFRLESGFWGGADQRIGLDVSAFYIPPVSSKFDASSGTNGSPLLGRPFFNTNDNVGTINGNTSGPDLAPISAPGFGTGNISINVTSQFWGIDPNLIVNLFRSEPGGSGWSLNFIAGYRYMRLQESILVRSNTVLAADTLYNNVNILAGSNVAVSDYFLTNNQFNGGQVGLETQASAGRWFFSATGKVAFGMTQRRITIEGSTSDGAANTFVGGVYANSANIGQYSSSQFAIATDVNGTLGFMLTPRLIGTVGYNFIFMGSVNRPGNSINSNIDPTTAPGVFAVGGVAPVGAPALQSKQDDFWMHGVNFGFIVKY